MKDGRVAAMGGGLCGNCAINQRNGEIYEPPYLFESTGLLAARPVITQAASEANAGNSLTVAASDNITAFNMVRLVALTHHHTADQRFIPLDFQSLGAGSYSVDLPSNANVLLPGYYWIFALNENGVPSVGHSIKINVTAPEVDGAPGVITPDNLTGNEVSYEYFEGDWNELPNFDALTPVLTGTQSSISLEPAISDDFFAFRFTTQIELSTAGEYTFLLSSDDGSSLELNGQTIVTYGGLHAASETRIGNVTLAAGLHNVVVTYFEKTGGEALLLDILGPEIVRQPISNLVATSQGTNPDQGEIIPSPAEDDVHYEYYEGEWNNLPNFDSLTPVITGRLPEISLVPATRDDFYALRFTTQIELPATGAYTFYLKSDDGSELMVNGQTVVNHDGLHNALSLIHISEPTRPY